MLRFIQVEIYSIQLKGSKKHLLNKFKTKNMQELVDLIIQPVGGGRSGVNNRAGRKVIFKVLVQTLF